MTPLPPSSPPAGTYPSGSAAPPSSGPSAWPPAAPPTGTAPRWGWGGRWLQSGPAGPAHSPPGLATGPAPGTPAYSRRRPRPAPPPARRPRPPRSSHLACRKQGASQRPGRGVRGPAAPARPECQPSSSLLTSWGWIQNQPTSPPGWPRVPIKAGPSRGLPGQPRGGQRLGESERVSVRGTPTCSCTVGRGHTDKDWRQRSPRSHAHTHAPTYSMKAEEEAGRERGGRGKEGGQERARGLRLGFRAQAPGGAVLEAGGPEAGGRRRRSLASSWGIGDSHGASPEPPLGSGAGSH